MNPTQTFTNLLAEIQTWLTTTRATIATRKALFIARLRARWTAVKGWFARKKKIIFWSAVVLVTSVLTIALLAYLYRRSPTVRAALDSLLGNAISWPGKVMHSIRRWATLAPARSAGEREAPQPVKAIAAPPRGDEARVVAEEAEPIPAMPSQDGPMPEEMKL